MNVSGSTYLGWQYLKRSRGKAILLISAITLSLFLPVGISLVVYEAEKQLHSRAEETPLLVGRLGSALELVFNGLYFSKPEISLLKFENLHELSHDGLGEVIPLYARFQARGWRIVGTTLDYFTFRNLRINHGRGLGRIGECVIGATVARELELSPGDFILSTPESVFDIAGIYPLKMRVVGVLAASGGPDDRVVFVDLKTAWIIEGLAHGHQDVENEKFDSEQVLEREGKHVSLNASLVEYSEITAENVDSFHFHGDMGEFPVSAGIVLPKDDKSETILLGRYLSKDKDLQLIQPVKVMRELFATVFQIKALVVFSLISIGVVCFFIVGLVFILSNKLRTREFESLQLIGADPGSIRLLLLFEASFSLFVSLIVTVCSLFALYALTPKLLVILLS